MSGNLLSIFWALGIDGPKHVNTVVKKISNGFANAFKETTAVILDSPRCRWRTTESIFLSDTPLFRVPLPTRETQMLSRNTIISLEMFQFLQFFLSKLIQGLVKPLFFSSLLLED